MNLLPISFLDELVAIRRDLHAHPELAFQEIRTADIVAHELRSYGLEVHCGFAGTGVVGVWRKGRNPRAIGLRADMDALPLLEKNTFDYCSKHVERMHACGHDGHTTMLLGAARYLAENHDDCDFDGTVFFIFQPAEESESGSLGGANAMIRQGLFQKFPMEAIFGLHNWPGIPLGEIVVMPGPIMAGTCIFEINVHGQGSHAAMPHQGVDTLVAASHLVLGLQTIIARDVNPCEAAVVSVTQIHGGEAFNVIPDDAVLRGTIRYFKQEILTLVEESIRRICSGTESMFGVSIEITFNPRYPPTVNCMEKAKICREVGIALVGEERVRGNELPSMGAEDFSYFLKEKPGCYIWLGNGAGTSGEGACVLHNPRYDFNDGLLGLGVSYWVRLIESYLRECSG